MPSIDMNCSGCCEYPDCPPPPNDENPEGPPDLIAEVTVGDCEPPTEISVPWTETDGWLGNSTFNCPCGWPPDEFWSLVVTCDNPNNWDVSLGAPTGTTDLTIISLVTTPAISIIVTGTMTCQQTEFDPPTTYPITIVITEA